MTAVDGPVVDVSRLLGTGGWGAWAVYAVFVATNATLALLTLDKVKHPFVSVVALAGILAAAALLARDARDPFPSSWTTAVLGAGLLATALVAWNVVPNDGPGRERWHVFAFTWMLFLLTMRGRALAAWAGLAGMVAITALGAVVTDRGAGAAAAEFQTSVAIVLVATLFTRALRRASSEINEARGRAVGLASAAAEVHAVSSVRRRRLDDLRATAAPLLRRVLASAVTSDQDRIDYRLGEAAVRDLIRGRSLVTSDVAAAARDARARGVDVTLLDDRGEQLTSVMAARIVAVRTVEALRAAREGSVTVRLAPAGRPVAVSIVVANFASTARTEFDEDGGVVSDANGPSASR